MYRSDAAYLFSPGGDDVGVSSSGHYGTGVMHQNPSFGGVSGLGDSVGRSSGISSDLLEGSTGYSYYTEGTDWLLHAQCHCQCL